ncbi:MAG: nitroreductase [Pseudomonadales bacterium]|nr:nitroreductase [Pseudomonadales bacterium]
MKALDALHSRISAPRLCDPPPDESALENIYRAAFRAADHGLLRPWRFLIIRGESRNKLGDLFLEASLEQDSEIPVEKQQNIRQKPLRAPLLLVTISSLKEHPKVPEFEQDLSAGAASQNMLVAAHAQGVGAMWRTGSMAYHPTVMKGLGLQDHEKIIGFLYLGTINGPLKTLSEPDIDEFFQEW